MAYIEFRIRRDSADQWIVKNPILSNGEPGFDETSNILKIGNGFTPWVDLPGIGLSSNLDYNQVFEQDSPSASWVILNNLGRMTSISVYIDGELVDADVFMSPTIVSISFPSPVSGIAVLT